MKKLLLGIGSFAAAAAPVAAVVACGDDDNKVVPNGMVHSFAAAGSPTTGIGHSGTNESTNYNRFKLVAYAPTEAMKAIVAADANVLTDSTHLDNLETALRNFLLTGSADKYKAQKDVENTLGSDSQIVVGTFKATPSAANDDHVEMGVNGFATEAATIAFLKDAFTHATFTDAVSKTIFQIMLNGL